MRNRLLRVFMTGGCLVMILGCGEPAGSSPSNPTAERPSAIVATPAVGAPLLTPRPAAADTPAPFQPTPSATHAQETPAMDFALTSTAFAEGEPIPARHTCDGADAPIPLAWSGTPAGTAELALVFHDPDAGGFVHWVVAAIPGDVSELDGRSLPKGAIEGRNDFGGAGYRGPCPPSGSHGYVLTLWALSAPLGLSEPISARDVRRAAADVTLAQADLRGTYRRTR